MNTLHINMNQVNPANNIVRHVRKNSNQGKNLRPVFCKKMNDTHNFTQSYVMFCFFMKFKHFN